MDGSSTSQIRGERAGLHHERVDAQFPRRMLRDPPQTQVPTSAPPRHVESVPHEMQLPFTRTARFSPIMVSLPRPSKPLGEESNVVGAKATRGERLSAPTARP